MKILICCNRKDFFLTRICVASIRYYYADVDIYILKDYLNGEFDSAELENSWNVKVLDLGIRKYGWSAAKMHILFSNIFIGEKILVIDSDIVFVGRFLENLYSTAQNYDFTVHADFHDNPYDKWVPIHYYDFDYLKSIDPKFKFPGYFFNGGQMIVTTGKIDPKEVKEYFDLGQFPYWKSTKYFPFVDQSLLNYIMPKKEQAGEITINKQKFMIWSEGPEAAKLDINLIKQGDTYPFLIHWAGALRIPYISKMTRHDVLNFFEEYYYSQVERGNIKKNARRIFAFSDYYLRKTYRGIKKRILKKKMQKMIYSITEIIVVHIL